MLSVREIKQSDIDLIIQYWLEADPAFLQGMGVDLSKMPVREQWVTSLTEQLSQSYKEKQSYCIIWLADDKPVGHSNVNKIVFGQEAYMHLHLWKPDIRHKGMGTALVKMTLHYFFKNLQLKRLYCEPYALNPSPNKTLKKAGFTWIKEYQTIPGWLNFEQVVNLWEITYDNYTTIH
jgi:RimJ/RimL family protein N-acetyltransferase